MPSNRDLLLDSLTHDLKVSRYDLSIVESVDSTKQRLKVRLKFFFSEWFLNRQFGVPYYENILRKSPDIALIESLIKTAILTTPKVLEILSFEIDFDNAARRLFVNFSVLTEDGIINSTETLP